MHSIVCNFRWGKVISVSSMIVLQIKQTSDTSTLHTYKASSNITQYHHQVLDRCLSFTYTKMNLQPAND